MRDRTKVVVLILLPINAWLFVFLYLNHQKAKYFEASHDELLLKDEIVIGEFLRQKYGVQVGQRLHLPFSKPSVGLPPPVGGGYPICFIHISGLALPGIWEPVIAEALKASPHLYVVLLYSSDWDLASIREMVQKFDNPRLSAVGLEIRAIERAIGNYRRGVLLILCDGKGIVKAVELYPPLKISPYLEDEVTDWRPKLHQAVKKVLDKFFPKGKSQ